MEKAKANGKYKRIAHDDAEIHRVHFNRRCLAPQYYAKIEREQTHQTHFTQYYFTFGQTKYSQHITSNTSSIRNTTTQPRSSNEQASEPIGKLCKYLFVYVDQRNKRKKNTHTTREKETFYRKFHFNERKSFNARKIDTYHWFWKLFFSRKRESYVFFLLFCILEIFKILWLKWNRIKISSFEFQTKTNDKQKPTWNLPFLTNSWNNLIALTQPRTIHERYSFHSHLHT